MRAIRSTPGDNTRSQAEGQQTRRTAAAERLYELVRLLWLPLLAYGLLSLAWSFAGLAAPVPPAHLHEYPPAGFLIEVGGHIGFGLIAAVPSLDLELVLLCGGESILIDTDHILTALNFPVQTRLSHSVGFMVLAPLVVYLIYSSRHNRDVRVVFVTLAAIFAHLAYDVFAGNGFFPLLAPLTLHPLSFGFWAGPFFEVAALGFAATAGVIRLGVWKGGTAATSSASDKGGIPSTNHR